MPVAAFARLLVLWLLCVPSANALKPENVTDGEFALLPPYCVDTQGFKYGASSNNRSPRALYWISRMGEEFWAMHHYCWGLINLQRAKRAGLSNPHSQFLVRSSIDDYFFVVHAAKPTFPLLPEIYTRIGESQLLLKRYNDARVSFERARALKRDYWPPYVRWADTLVSLKLDEEARELISQGLSVMPGEPALLERARKLGVRPPPAAASAASSAATSADAAAPASAPASATAPAAPPEGPASAPPDDPASAPPRR